MSDAYSNIVCDDGVPINGNFGISVFTKRYSVDTVDVIRQMYGMIWLMAEQILIKSGNTSPSRDEIMTVIDSARNDSERGFARGSSGL